MGSLMTGLQLSLLVLFGLMLAGHYVCPACAVFCSENSCGEQEGEKEVNMRHLRVSWKIVGRKTEEVVEVNKDKQMYRRQVQ